MLLIKSIIVLEVQFKLSQPKPPESVCSLPCDLGQAKQYVEGESCCWHCFNCTQYQVKIYSFFYYFILVCIPKSLSPSCYQFYLLNYYHIIHPIS